MTVAVMIRDEKRVLSMDAFVNFDFFEGSFNDREDIAVPCLLTLFTNLGVGKYLIIKSELITCN